MEIDRSKFKPLSRSIPRCSHEFVAFNKKDNEVACTKCGVIKPSK